MVEKRIYHSPPQENHNPPLLPPTEEKKPPLQLLQVCPEIRMAKNKPANPGDSLGPLASGTLKPQLARNSNQISHIQVAMRGFPHAFFRGFVVAAMFADEKWNRNLTAPETALRQLVQLGDVPGLTGKDFLLESWAPVTWFPLFPLSITPPQGNSLHKLAQQVLVNPTKEGNLWNPESRWVEVSRSVPCQVLRAQNGSSTAKSCNWLLERETRAPFWGWVLKGNQKDMMVLKLALIDLIVHSSAPGAESGE